VTINLQPIADAWLFLARALAMTLFISVLSTLFGFAIGVVVGGLRTYGGRLLNDVLSLYVDSMRANIANVLGVDAGCVSVKAKTGEGIDAVGQGLAVTAQAAVLMESN